MNQIKSANTDDCNGTALLPIKFVLLVIFLQLVWGIFLVNCFTPFAKSALDKKTSEITKAAWSEGYAKGVAAASQRCHSGDRP